MSEEKIILEHAKNGSFTCKYNINGTWKYLYSKYYPDKISEEFSIKKDSDFIIVLGLGLGYELKKIRKMTSKPIYVIEYDKSFYNNIKNFLPSEESGLLEDYQITYGVEYRKLNLDINRGQIISNTNIIQCNIQFYNNVIKHFYIEESNAPVICIFDHPTISNDCFDAFKQLGFTVINESWQNEDTLLRKVAQINPKYLFTINFSEIISRISECLRIPYISWTVDTPAYSLYNSKNLDNKWSFFFIYDEKVVNDLRRKGTNNIYYLPVAANVERLENIHISSSIKKYCSDLAFVGSRGTNNEYSNFIYPKISVSLRKIISKLIEKQFNANHFLLMDLIEDDLIKQIEKESGYKIDNDKHLLLSRKEKLAFLLGRYHSFLERDRIIETLSSQFDLNVYGDSSWNNIMKKTAKPIYRGYAEHYNEMPLIFKSTKINLNITRSFVESGLPMRIFDILGSKGFLVTNNKEDISRLFQDGRDLVVYRDMQDLIEIVRYYLMNHEERERIKEQGFQTIKKIHTYKTRIKEMMDIVEALISGSIKN